MVWPFKWNLSSCTFTWYYLFFKILKWNWEIFVEFCPWPHLAAKGLSHNRIAISVKFDNVSCATTKEICQKVCCTFRVFALLVKPVSHFTFLASNVTTQNNSWYATIFAWKTEKTDALMENGRWNRSLFFFLSLAPLFLSLLFSLFNYRFPLLLIYTIRLCRFSIINIYNCL